ncbi:Organic solute transporter subunit beta [Ophiophagus hannah]|uniref:Organic solute transporter subunit beta n=1 Tax=Ophiophagus hannah TaxID=8665 RepID=V8P1M8_OPHHA|nr:Organic solute transporter subunit beta [Ophiophagus hannah]
MGIFWTTLCFLVYALNTDLGVLALSSSQPQEDSEGLDNPSEDIVSPEMLQELLWFFRREDPSAWNYSILVLSVLVLLIGVVLLGANIRANRCFFSHSTETRRPLSYAKKAMKSPCWMRQKRSKPLCC